VVVVEENREKEKEGKVDGEEGRVRGRDLKRLEGRGERRAREGTGRPEGDLEM